MTKAVRALRPLQDFLRTEAAAGLLLLAMVPIALLWANGPFSDSYSDFWSTKFTLSLSSWELSLDLRHWVNDALMAIFFYVVGLEIKRELVDGELQDRRKAMTPALAAVGGMLVPAVIYVSMNVGKPTIDGWAIPMATDIAIVLGFLALLGKRVPASLKTFLLTLAIVDDIGAIAVIALFYGEHAIDLLALVSALVFFTGFWLLQRYNIHQPIAFIAVIVFAWIATYQSGIHATLAGVVLALLTPARPVQSPDYVDMEALTDLSTYEAANESANIARQSVSSVEWMQHVFHPWSSYLVLPLFALANAGISISSEAIEQSLSSSATLGVMAGLLIGKPLGICLFTAIAITIFRARLPEDVRFAHVAAGSVLASIGFTVSLFISELAFTNHDLVDQAKAGVLAASLFAGVAGSLLLHATLGYRNRSQSQ